MGTPLRRPKIIVPFVTTSAVRDGDLVMIATSDYNVTFPTGAAPTASILGVVMKPDGVAAASGDTVDVVVGGIYPVRAGGTITRNDLITSNGTDGTAKTETATAGVGVGVVGVALAAGVSGDLVSVLLAQFIKQGG